MSLSQKYDAILAETISELERATLHRSRSGATIKFKYTTDTFGYPLLACSRCKEFIHKHYYVHQCNKLPHYWCYQCLVDLDRCKVCHNLYKLKYQVYLGDL